MSATTHQNVRHLEQWYPMVSLTRHGLSQGEGAFTCKVNLGTTMGIELRSPAQKAKDSHITALRICCRAIFNSNTR